MSWQDATRRTWANLKGLDATAEWVLDPPGGTETDRSPGGGHFFNVRLTLAYQNLSAGDAEEQRNRLPLPFLITPIERTGQAGIALYNLLDAALEEAEARFVFPDSERDALIAGGTAAVLVEQQFFRRVLGAADGALAEFRNREKSIRLSSPLRAGAVPSPKTSELEPIKTKEAPKVVLGIVDDGFAIAHERFRLPSGCTRILALWDQEADEDPANPNVSPGRELLQEKINDILKLTVDQGLGEDAFYAHPELVPFFPLRRNHVPRRALHGTQVLDLAAGAEPGDMDDVPIMAVKLPRDSVLDTSGAHLEFYLLRAVRYLAARVPVGARLVIVSSYGFYGGPQDGASDFERELDTIIGQQNGNLQIVLPSGNGRLERTRATLKIGGKNQPASAMLHWRLQPDDRTPSFLELWLPVDGTWNGRVAVSVKTPEGRTSPDLGSDQTLFKIDHVEAATGLVQARLVVDALPQHGPSPDPRRRFLLSLQPTTRDGALPGDPPFAPAPPGPWTITVKALDGFKGRIEAHIRRDDSLLGFPVRGRQSQIDRSADRELDLKPDLPGLTPPLEEQYGDTGPAQRSGTQSAIATGDLTIIVGAYRKKDGYVSRYSAGGPLEPSPDGKPSRPTGPVALLPGDLSRTTPGILAAGFRTRSRLALSGTSAAAALLARELVRRAPADPIDRAWVSQRAEDDEKLPRKGPRPNPWRGGSGRIVSEPTRVDCNHRAPELCPKP